MKRRMLSSLCAAALVFSMAACGSSNAPAKDGADANQAASENTAANDTAASDDAAKEGGELILYTWEGMFPQEVLDGFTEKTGIEIVYSNFDTDETMLEKLSQAEGGTYDLVIADDYIIEQAVQAGLVQEIDKDTVTNFGNINPLYQGQFYDPDDKYTVPYGAGIPLIVYDPEQVDFEITGYEDLWNPELEDKVALTANYRVINGITLLSMGQSMNTEDVAVIEEAGKKLLDLAPNVRMIQDDNTQNALLNGEAAVAFLYTSQVTQVMAENPDLKVVYPKEGLGFGIMAGFIPSQAPNADAANEFLNYLLEPEVSAQCFDFLGYYCTTKAADDLVNPDLVVPDSVTKGEIIQNVSQGKLRRRRAPSQENAVIKIAVRNCQIWLDKDMSE